MLRFFNAPPVPSNISGTEQLNGVLLKSLWIDDDTGIIYAGGEALTSGGGGTPGGAIHTIQTNNGDGTFAGPSWQVAGGALSLYDDSAFIDLQSTDQTRGFFINNGGCGVFGINNETDLVNYDNYTSINGFLNVSFLGGGVDLFAGLGSPEGVISATPGSLMLRYDGDATTTLYIKTSTGTTGWAAVGGVGLTAPWVQNGPTITCDDDDSGKLQLFSADETSHSQVTPGRISLNEAGQILQYRNGALTVPGINLGTGGLDLSAPAPVFDSTFSDGTAGWLLSSLGPGAGVLWVAAGGGGGTPTLNQVTDPTTSKVFTFPAGASFLIEGTPPDSVSSGAGTNAGTLFTIIGVTGGAVSGTSETAGIGSSSEFQFGNGGDASGGTNCVGGLGGSFAIVTGNGGSSSGTAANSNGGDFVVQFGTAGSGGSGAAGRNGQMQVQGDMSLSGAFFDSTNASGSNGQFLTSSSGVTIWSDLPIAFAEQTTTLTSAQLLALHTTPVQLVPAPGANKVIAVVQCFFKYNFVTTAYTFDGSSDVTVLYTGWTSSMLAPQPSWATPTGLLDQTATTIGYGFPTGFGPLANGANFAPLSTAVNQPLYCNIAAALTLGNGTLEITVMYTIVDV